MRSYVITLLDDAELEIDKLSKSLNISDDIVISTYIYMGILAVKTNKSYANSLDSVALTMQKIHKTIMNKHHVNNA